jgi:hypothetical protein
MKESNNQLRREEVPVYRGDDLQLSSFDGLAKGMADGTITRGGALKIMGATLLGGMLGLSGLSSLGASAAHAKKRKHHKGKHHHSPGAVSPPPPPASPPPPPPPSLCPAGTPSMTACGSTSGCQCLFLNGDPNGTLVCAAGQGQGGTLCATNGTPLPGVTCPTGQVCAGGGGGNGRCRASCS